MSSSWQNMKGRWKYGPETSCIRNTIRNGHLSTMHVTQLQRIKSLSGSHQSHKSSWYHWTETAGCINVMILHQLKMLLCVEWSQIMTVFCHIERIEKEAARLTRGQYLGIGLNRIKTATREDWFIVLNVLSRLEKATSLTQVRNFAPGAGLLDESKTYVK